MTKIKLIAEGKAGETNGIVLAQLVVSLPMSLDSMIWAGMSGSGAGTGMVHTAVTVRQIYRDHLATRHGPVEEEVGEIQDARESLRQPRLLHKHGRHRKLVELCVSHEARLCSAFTIPRCLLFLHPSSPWLLTSLCCHGRCSYHGTSSSRPCAAQRHTPVPLPSLVILPSIYVGLSPRGRVLDVATPSALPRPRPDGLV